MAATQQKGTGTPSALRDALTEIVRRLQLARRLRLVSRGALVAACLSLLAVGLAHGGFLPVWLPLELTIPFLLMLGVGFGLLLAARHPVDPMTAARLAEGRLGLKERLSSALEFERTGAVPADPEAALLLRLQGEDASAHARALQPIDAVPIPIPWEAKALLVAVVLLLLALVLPSLPVFTPPSVRAERAVVQRSGEELARTARVIEKNADAQGLPATKHAAQDMQKLGNQMAAGHMDKKQAMVQMARLSKQMAAEQRRAAPTNSSPAQEGKNLPQAGEQLAQSLLKSDAGQGAKPSGGISGKSGNARARDTLGQSGPKSSNSPGASDVQRAAQSMKQGSASGLAEQLRNQAQHIASHPMSPTEQRQAAQDLQKLSDALKGTPLSGAQKQVQSAADALKHGDPQRAANDIHQAADAADRQGKPQQDAQGVQDAKKSLLSGEQQLAQATTPADIPHGAPGQTGVGEKTNAPATPQTKGQGTPPRRPSDTAGKAAGAGHHGGQPQTAGQNSSAGSPPGGVSGNQDGGSGKSASTTPGAARAQSATGQGEQTPPHTAGIVRGAPHPLDSKFDPTKNPKYGKIFLGAGDGSSSGGGKLLKSQRGTSPPGEPRASYVPYYSSLAPARKTAETAMDREDIPPAYRSSVRQYFDSLQPSAGKSSK